MCKKRILFLSILLLLFINVNAQFYQLNLPFVEESSQPELFLMEPHYNSKNEITHYTLGDFMKAEYIFNEQNMPLSKTLYQWNKHDYTWEVASKTVYKYNSDNKLTEERTEQLYPIIKNREVNYIKTTINLKQITYNTTTNTDTIREFKNVPAISTVGLSFNGYFNTLCSVRYNNKNGITDSVITETKYSDDYTFRQKTVYNYDRKNQNITSEQFVENNNLWVLMHRTTTKYEKNKTTYTQTQITLSEEDLWEEDLIEENGINYEGFKQATLQNITFTIEFDKQKRIIAKTLDTGDKVVLKAKYSYNQQGNTIIEHEQNLDNRLLSSIGIPGNIPDEFKHLKYTIDYNSDNCSTSNYYIRNREGKLFKLAEIINCYSAENLLLSSDMTRYNDDDGAFNDREIVKIIYNTNLSGEKTFYRVHDEEDRNDILSHPSQKIIFKNNALGKNIYEEKLDYDDDNNKWVFDRKLISDYDENAYKKHSEGYTYNKHNKKWEGAYYGTYIRDSLNRILVEEDKIWENDKWQNRHKLAYFYNTDHEKTLEEMYVWNLTKMYWEGTKRDSTVYSNEGNIIIELGYIWAENERHWQPKWKTEYNINIAKSDLIGGKLNNNNIRNSTSFDVVDNIWMPNQWTKEYNQKSSSSEITTYEWVGDKWIPQKQNFDRVTHNPPSRHKGSAEWNENTNKWDIRYEDKIIHTDSINREETYWWDFTLSELEGHSNIVFKNTPSDSSLIEEKTYSLWNYANKNWDIAARHTKQSNDKGSTFIFEKYDQAFGGWRYEQKKFDEKINDTTIYLTLFLWDNQEKNWVISSRKIFYYNPPYNPDYESNYHKYEYQVFNKTTRKLEPLYSGEDVTFNKQTGTQFYKWNNKSQRWEPYFIETGSGWSKKQYQWDSIREKWNEIDGWNYKTEQQIEKITAELHESLNTDKELDYNKLIKENKQKYFDIKE